MCHKYIVYLYLYLHLRHTRFELQRNYLCMRMESDDPERMASLMGHVKNRMKSRQRHANAALVPVHACSYFYADTRSEEPLRPGQCRRRLLYL